MYNKFPTKCWTCGKSLKAGDATLAGQIREGGDWIAYCRSGVGCNMPKVAPKPPVAMPAADDSYIGRLLKTTPAKVLKARGWNVDEMIAEQRTWPNQPLFICLQRSRFVR